MTASPSAARRCRSASVRRAATSTITAFGWWNAPTRFLPSGRSTAVLPPIELSSWATSVVGTWMSGIPRRYVAARKPAASPSAPPPTATSGSRALDPQPGQLAGRALDDRQPLGRLALRHEAELERQPGALERGGDRRADRAPCARLRDDDRPRRAEPPELLDEEPPRDALAEDDPADGRRRRQEGRAGSDRSADDCVDRLDDRAHRGEPVDPVAGRVEALPRGHERADRPERIGSGDERPRVRAVAEALGERLGRPVEPDDRPAAVQPPAVARVDDRAAAGRDDPARPRARGSAARAPRPRPAPGPGSRPRPRARRSRRRAGRRRSRSSRRGRRTTAPWRAVSRRPTALLPLPGSPTRTRSTGRPQSSPPEPTAPAPSSSPDAAARPRGRCAAPRPPATGASGARAIRSR